MTVKSTIESTIKVSIIIPVYNVEKYIERCARSIFEQTYNNLEIIFVDDCTPDNSIKKLEHIISNYPGREEQIKIIHHKTNKGLATARNTGLKNATGEYILHCDSDDWMSPTQTEGLVAIATEYNCDIVYSDFFKSPKEGDRLIKQDFGTDKEKCLAAMLSGKMHCGNWNKMFRRSLYTENEISYVDGADMHEDVGTVIRLFGIAQKIGYLPKAFYHYNQSNESSLLKVSINKEKQRKACLQRIKNTDIAINFLKQHNVWTPAIQHAAADCELRAKDELIDDSTYSLKRWIVTFPEADEAIWSCPFLNLNLRFLFTWLHFHQIWLYKLQKKITSLCSG